MSIIIRGDLQEARALLSTLVSGDLAGKITDETIVLDLPGFTVYLRKDFGKLPKARAMMITCSPDDAYICETPGYRQIVSKKLILPQLIKMHKRMTSKLAQETNDALVRNYLRKTNSKELKVYHQVKQHWREIVKQRGNIEANQMMYSFLFGIIGGIFGFVQTDNAESAAGFGMVFFLAALLRFAFISEPLKKPEFDANIKPEVKKALDKMYKHKRFPRKPERPTLITKDDLDDDNLTLDCLYHDPIADQLLLN